MFIQKSNILIFIYFFSTCLYACSNKNIEDTCKSKINGGFGIANNGKDSDCTKDGGNGGIGIGNNGGNGIRNIEDNNYGNGGNGGIGIGNNGGNGSGNRN